MQLLNQYLLNICYILDWINIVLNTLLRFPNNITMAKKTNPEFNKLDILYAYNIMWLEINKAFIVKLCKRYDDNLI